MGREGIKEIRYLEVVSDRGVVDVLASCRLNQCKILSIYML